MLDHSFPAAKPPSEFHSVAQSLVGFEQKPIFSSLVKPVQEPLPLSWQALGHIQQHEIDALLKPLTFHADPLMPLRQRDQHALDEVFNDIQVEEVLADIYLRLKQLYPEPCWEDNPFDNPFDFLKEYM